MPRESVSAPSKSGYGLTPIYMTLGASARPTPQGYRTPGTGRTSLVARAASSLFIARR